MITIVKDTHIDLHLSDLKVALVLGGQDHSGFPLATFSEKTFGASIVVL